mgnify:CR=1 FL=1
MIKISQHLRRCVQVFPGLVLLFGASMVEGRISAGVVVGEDEIWPEDLLALDSGKEVSVLFLL